MSKNTIAPFSESHVMAAFGCPKVRVVSAKVSPLNAQRWSLALSCGHDVWVTAKRKPARKTMYCTTCGEVAVDAATKNNSR